MAEPRGPRLQTVCFILSAPLFALVACGLIGATLEEDIPRAGAGNLKDRTLVVTPAVDDLTEVHLIGVDTP
jgi:hypothetical protein